MNAPLQLSMLMPRSEWTAPEQFPDLRGCRRIAVDVETRDPDLDDLGPGVRRGAEIVGLCVGTDRGERAYLPVGHEGGGNLPPALVWGWARKELNAFDGEIVGARLIYDLDFLAEVGVTFPRAKRFRDVQLAEPLLDEHRYAYGLEELSRDYLGVGKDAELLHQAAIAYGLKKPTDAQVKKLLWRMPARLVGPYGEADVDRPLRILELQEEQLKKEDLLELFDLECRLIPMVLAMTRRGVRVDLDRIGQVRRELVAERDAALARVRYIAGPKAELLAAESLAPALRERGLDVRTTRTGVPSITKAFLERNAGDELIDAIAEGRKVNTIINTFLDGLSRHAVVRGTEARVHCTFNQLKGEQGGTIARFSAQDPNLQNIPARDERLGPLVRSLFLPEPGHAWQCMDLSQIEYRILAHYAMGDGATECRARYNDDPKTDFHKLCAEMIGVDPEDGVRRKRVKNVNFGKLYGARVNRLAVVMGCTTEEASDFVEEYERSLPFTVTTFNNFAKRAAQRGYIVTLKNRRMRFPLWEPSYYTEEGRPVALPLDKAKEKWPDVPLKRARTYVALNRGLQGGAADLLKQGMVDIWESGVCDVLGAPLVTVHDELDDSIPPTPEGQEAADEAQRLLERAIPLRVPVLATRKRGTSWGDCE